MAELNDKEKRKFDVIKKVFIGEITKEQAQKELNLGIRQINRLLIKFKNNISKSFMTYCFICRICYFFCSFSVRSCIYCYC